MQTLRFNEDWNTASLEAADDELDLDLDPDETAPEAVDEPEEEESLPDSEVEVDEDAPPEDDVGDDILDDTDASAEPDEPPPPPEDPVEEAQKEADKADKELEKEEKKEQEEKDKVAVTALKKAAMLKSKSARSGYVDQPRLAVYLPDKESVESLFGQIQVRGAHVAYVPLTLTSSQEGMQTMINGVVQREEELQRQQYVESQKTLRYHDYSLYVIAEDTDLHLYNDIEPMREAAVVVLPGDNEVEEGVLSSLEARFTGGVYRSWKAAEEGMQARILSGA